MIPTADTRGGTRGLGVLVLIAAVLQVVAPAITINGPGTSPGGSGAELLISPAGWAFSIWGVIYALAIVQAVVALARGADRVPRRLQIDLLVLYLGATMWIVLAGLDSSVATAGALAVMLLAAVDGTLTTARSLPSRGLFPVLTRVAVGLYAGWVTAAFFLNVSTALVDAGVTAADDLSWQLVALGAAVLTLLVLVAATRGLAAYAVAGCWALVGITATGITQGVTVVAVVAVASAVLLLVATGLARRGRLSPRPGTA